MRRIVLLTCAVLLALWARILPVKALDEEGGSFEDIALGIRYGIVDAQAAVAAPIG